MQVFVVTMYGTPFSVYSTGSTLAEVFGLDDDALGELLEKGVLAFCRGGVEKVAYVMEVAE